MGIRIGDYFEKDHEFAEEDILFTMIDMGMEIKPEKIKEWYQSHKVLMQVVKTVKDYTEMDYPHYPSIKGDSEEVKDEMLHDFHFEVNRILNHSGKLYMKVDEE